MEITAQQYIRNKKNGSSFVVVYKSVFGKRNEKVEKDGDVYILFRIASQTKIPLTRLARFVIDAVVDGYLYSPAKSTNEAVKDAMKDGVSKMKSMMRNDKDLEETGIDTNFSVVLVKKEGVYVGRFGDNDIYVCKKDKCVNISEVMQKKNAETAGIVLEDKEILFVSTNGVLERNIVNIMPSLNKDSFARTMATIGMNLSDGEGLLYIIANKKKAKARALPIDEEMKKIIKPEDAKSNEVTKKMKFFANIKIFCGKSITKAKVLWKSISARLKMSSSFKGFGVKVFGVFKKIFSSIGSFFANLFEKFNYSFRNKRWYKKVGAKISTVKINTMHGRKSNVSANGYRVDNYKVKELRGKRFKLVVSVAFIICLVAFGVNFTIKTKENNRISKLANEKFTSITELLDKAESSVSTDKSSAEMYIFQAENLFKDVPDGLNEKDSLELKDLSARCLNISDSLYKKIAVSVDSNMSKYLDARLAFGEGSSLTDIEIYKAEKGDEYLLITDDGLNSVYRVKLSDKSVETVPNDDKLLKEPTYLSIGVEGIYIYDKSVGMLKSSFDDSGNFGSIFSISGLSKNDIDDNSISGLIVLTDADNIYLVSQENRAVMKSYAAYENRYSMLFTYISNDEFNSAVDILGDLSVYVLTNNDTKIARYSWSYVEQEQVENVLTITGLSGDVGNLVGGYTYSESMYNNLYAYDSDGKRVLRFEKPLESESLHPNELLLLNQYEYRGEDSSVWSDVKDIVVDVNEDYMYVLESNSVWMVSL